MANMMSPELFSAMGNYETYNDPTANLLLDRVSKVIFGKPLSQLGGISRAMAQMAGQVLINTYGGTIGMNDGGQNFMQLHQAIAGMAAARGLTIKDQFGKTLQGVASGPGVVSIMAARAVNQQINNAMYSSTGVQKGYITGNLGRGILAGMRSQHILEEGGMRPGDVIVGKNFEPGIAGAKKGIQQMLAQGAAADDPALRQLATAVTIATAINEEKNKEEYKPFRDAVTAATERVAKLEAILENIKPGDPKGSEVIDKLTIERENLRKSNAELHEAARKNTVGKRVRSTDVAGVKSFDTKITDEAYDATDELYQGQLSVTAINQDVERRWQEAISRTKSNVEQLSKIFNTEDFNELQKVAKELNMGSLTNKNNAADVARRIQHAQAEAERTGRSIKEIFDEQAALIEITKGTSGYAAGSATVERMQRTRTAAQAAASAGHTNLSVEQVDAQTTAANNISLQENKRAIVAMYKLEELKKTKDPSRKEDIKKLTESRDKYLNETDPEKKEMARKEFETLSAEIHGSDSFEDEVNLQKALDAGMGEIVLNSSARSVISTSDAEGFYKRKYGNMNATKSARADALFGRNAEDIIPNLIGNTQMAYGGNYGQLGGDAAMGASMRDELNTMLEDMNPKAAAAILKYEEENSRLDARIAAEPNEKKREQLREQKEKNYAKIGKISPNYEAKIKANNKAITELIDNRASTMRASGEFSETEVQNSMRAAYFNITSAASVNADYKELGNEMRRWTETSKAIGGHEGNFSIAQNAISKNDQFLNSLEDDRTEANTQHGFEQLAKDFISGKRKVTEKNALLASVKTLDAISYDRESGKQQVDVDKINSKSSIGAIKAKRTDEENEKLAKDPKIRTLLGTKTVKETLKLLSDNTALITRMRERTTSGAIHTVKLGEDEDAVYAMETHENSQARAALLTYWLNSNVGNRYLKGIAFDGVTYKENGNINTLTIGDTTLKTPEDIEKALVEQATVSPEARENYKQLSDTDEMAARIYAQAAGINRVAAFSPDTKSTMKELQELYGKHGKRSWDKLSAEERQMFQNDRNVFEFKQANFKTLNDPLRVAKEGKSNKAWNIEYEKARKELGIDEKVAFEDLSVEQAAKINALISQRDADYNKQVSLGDDLLDFRKLKESGMMDAMGNVTYRGSTFNAYSAGVMDIANQQAAMRGEKGYDEQVGVQSHVKNIATSLQQLVGCVRGQTLLVKQSS